MTIKKLKIITQMGFLQTKNINSNFSMSNFVNYFLQIYRLDIKTNLYFPFFKI